MRRLRLSSSISEDPLDGMANLFDLGVVFALGFGIAVLARAAQDTSTYAAQAHSAPVPDRTQPIERFRSTNDQLGGNGQRLGTAYRLANGEVVYVPDDATTKPASASR